MIKKIGLFRLIAKPHVLEILNELKTKPKRYITLRKVCNNDKTLSKKLETLQENELIKTVAVKFRGKYANCYALTEKGKKVLQEIEELKI